MNNLRIKRLVRRVHRLTRYPEALPGSGRRIRSAFLRGKHTTLRQRLAARAREERSA